LLTDLHLFQYISEPSRVTPVSSTLIDHFIITPNLTVNLVYQIVGLSDHLLQVVNISNVRSVKPAQSVMYVRSYRHCDWDAVRGCLRTAPWYVMDIFDDIDDKWHFFQVMFKLCSQSACTIETGGLQIFKKANSLAY